MGSGELESSKNPRIPNTKLREVRGPGGLGRPIARPGGEFHDSASEGPLGGGTGNGRLVPLKP